MVPALPNLLPPFAFRFPVEVPVIDDFRNEGSTIGSIMMLSFPCFSANKYHGWRDGGGAQHIFRWHPVIGRGTKSQRRGLIAEICEIVSLRYSFLCSILLDSIFLCIVKRTQNKLVLNNELYSYAYTGV